MNGRHLFLTSSGLTDKMKKKFFDIIGKRPKDVKVLYIPTAGIETDGVREGIAICFHYKSPFSFLFEYITTKSVKQYRI